MGFQVVTLVNGSLEENCYFLHADGRQDGLLIDPGSSPEQLAQALERRGLRPALILATHAHFDHVGAVAALASRFQARFAMAQADEPLLEVLEDTAAFYGQGAAQRPQVDRWLRHGEVLSEAGLEVRVLATPGHTPGGLCFWHAASGSLFCGDTLFAGSVGRSDFEGGSHEQLIAGIRREILALPDEARVYPGHGEATTVGRERRENRFLQP